MVGIGAGCMELIERKGIAVRINSIEKMNNHASFSSPFACASSIIVMLRFKLNERRITPRSLSHQRHRSDYDVISKTFFINKLLLLLFSHNYAHNLSSQF